MPRPLRVLAPLLLLVCLAPPAAQADYTVFGCRGPAGTPNAATGWQLGQIGAAGSANTCLQGGGLGLALAPQAPGGSVARLRFDAPAGTRIVRLGAQRRTGGVGTTDQTLDATYELSTDTTILEKCAIAADSACTADLVDPLDKQGIDAAWVRFSVVCAKGGDERCTRPVRVDVNQVAVTLKDAVAPVVGGVRVTDDGDATGVLRLAFDASDQGGGLYRALVKIDGETKAVVPLGAGDCADAAPGDADPYQFLVPVPCPAVAAGVPVAVSSEGLAPGPHTVSVDVEDAAGNSTSAYVTQFPRPNVSPSSVLSLAELLDARLTMRFDRNKRPLIASRFGDRVVIRGVLRSRKTGRGITGARIDVYHLVGTRLRSLTKTGLKTRAGGALTLILPRDLDTRRIRFTYRAVRPGRVTSESRLQLRVRDRAGRLVRRVR